MSVTTVSDFHHTGFFARLGEAFSSFGDRVIAGRMKEAEHRVAYHLLALDEKTLAEHGYDRAALKKLTMGSPALY